MTKEVISEELQMQMNAYKDYAIEFSTEYIHGLFRHGIIDTVTAEKLNQMFSNPDNHQEEIEKLAEYFYISNAEVRQMFEMVEVLPQLNYSLISFTENKTSQRHLLLLNKHLHKIKHKRLTRDLMKQNASIGNVVGIWLGDKKDPFPYVFDNMKYVFPIGRNYRGEWVCIMDLSWFDTMTEPVRDLYFDTFNSIDIRKHYEEYRAESHEKKYFTLPFERTFCIGTGKLKRNQALGTSWVTSGLMDVLHKKKLKDVEQSIANKIINAVAVLTVGSDKNENYTNAKLPKSVKQKIHTGVKAALEKKQLGGVSLVTVPEYAKLDFPDIDTDGLDGKKFETINSDIRSAYGLSSAVLNGEGTNYASSKLNLEIQYKKLGVMLEDIEDEVYRKLFNLMVPDKNQDDYYIEYNKEMPLTLKEKLDYMKGLTDKGWATKPFIESLGFNFNSYWEQTLYEQETLKTIERIQPPKTSYTTSGNKETENNGRPPTSDSEVENENTVRTRESDDTR